MIIIYAIKDKWSFKDTNEIQIKANMHDGLMVQNFNN